MTARAREHALARSRSAPDTLPIYPGMHRVAKSYSLDFSTLKKAGRGLVAGKRAGTHRLEARTVLALATAERDMEAEMAAILNFRGTVKAVGRVR